MKSHIDKNRPDRYNNYMKSLENIIKVFSMKGAQCTPGPVKEECVMKKTMAALLAASLAWGEETPITVTEIQKYGNLVLSVPGSELMSRGYAYGDVVTVTLNGQEYDMPVGSNYSDVDQGSMICRVVVKPDLGEDYVVLAINNRIDTVLNFAGAYSRCELDRRASHIILI